MKLFYLNRLKDITGVSGNGKVAEGVVFDNGKVCLMWIVGIESIVIHESLENLIKVAGHDGNTQVVYY